MLTFHYRCHKFCISVFTRTLLYAWEAITNSNCNAWIDDRSSKFLTRKAPRILLLWLCVVMQILHNYKLENFPKECAFWSLVSLAPHSDPVWLVLSLPLLLECKLQGNRECDSLSPCTYPTGYHLTLHVEVFNFSTMDSTSLGLLSTRFSNPETHC